MKNPVLELSGVSAFYGDFRALFDIDLRIAAGEAVALIGANGAGKTTLLRAICGLIRTGGTRLAFAGESIAGFESHEVARLGIAMVPEGRRLFPSLRVSENLEVGGYRAASGPWNRRKVEELFPVLAGRRNMPATLLSGGEQQMVAIGRALMRNPRLLLLDEVSLGLAPAVINEIYAAFAGILAHGTALLIVEQDITRALANTARFYCLQEGRISLSGKPGEFDRRQIAAAYFGQEVA